MKEHFQDYGIRKWAGNDLIELQSEPLEALQKLVEPYAPCILQGCEVTENEGDTITIESGLVALQGKDYKGEDCVKIARFAGIADTTHPVYLILECEPDKRVYGDSKSKAIAYHYTAVATTQEPEKPYLEINASGNKRLVDTLGITQKLDREGGDASNVKVFFNDKGTDTEDLKSGNTLSKLFGGIKKWLDRKVDKIDGKSLSANDFTKEYKEKLESLEVGLDGFSIYRISSSLSVTSVSGFSIATYFPSSVLNGRTLQVGDLFIEASESSYLYRITAVTTNTWSATRLISLRGAQGTQGVKGDTGAAGPTGATGSTGPQGVEGLGIWRSSITTSTTTSSITLSTITIPTGRSVKVGDLIIANSTYSYLYRVTAVSSTTATVTYLTSLRGATGAQGTAGTNATTTAVATTSANGLMSAADKTKLDKIGNVSITINGNKIRFTWNKSVSGNMDVSGTYYVEFEGTFQSGGGMVIAPGL